MRLIIALKTTQLQSIIDFANKENETQMKSEMSRHSTKTSAALGQLRIGLAMWSHPAWANGIFTANADGRLAAYAAHFSTVEGNTTFYATPSLQVAKQWDEQTPSAFRFTFKLPKSITHDAQLRQARGLCHEFFSQMTPVMEKTALWCIQLPAQFSGADLPTLQRFCQTLPESLPIAIEVRHADFFAKGEWEKRFNQWLIESNYDRVIMDSRPVFSVAPTNPILVEAQKVKPRVPVHAISTGGSPMIRFIGLPTLEDNQPWFDAWLKKLPLWINEGKSPFLMIHTADNDFAPQLAHDYYKQLSALCELPPITPLALNDGRQMSIF